MAETPQAPATPPTVTDNRPVPRGVLPRGMQTWIMAGVAGGMPAIMLLVGRSDPPVRTTSAPAAAQAPSTDRVRDYQERLRAMEAQALREAQAATGTPAPAVMGFQEPPSAPAPDPLDADRKRREYESLVTNAVYSHSGQHVVIPAGARVLGTTRPVRTLGETRLAVMFHRLLMPDGRTYRLDQFKGLNQIGDAGLPDKVNHHYLATFGAAAAVGLISGLAQYLGNFGLGAGDGDRTVIIAGGVGDAASQATIQVMNRFLNRLPTVTIREGHRVKVYLTSDLELPAYESAETLRG